MFHPQDVTDTERLHNLGDIWTQDLFVVNFLLSRSSLTIADSTPL